MLVDSLRDLQANKITCLLSRAEPRRLGLGKLLEHVSRVLAEGATEPRANEQEFLGCMRCAAEARGHELSSD